MTPEEEKRIITERFGGEIDVWLERMTFSLFANGRRYSFDHHLRTVFEGLRQELEAACRAADIPVSPALTNKIPVFLPPDTRRIAFFSYRSKSVRAVDPERLETLLRQQAKKKKLSPDEAEVLVRKDLAAFDEYRKQYDFDAWRMDVETTAVQFNAYDGDDNLLIEKGFVRGGLVFALPPDRFEKDITVTYPRHRKQRSDKKNDYLPLELIKIRGIHLRKKDDQKG